MKVSFTQKEYARLLELAYMGLWVAGARTDTPNTTPERYAAVTQKLLSLADSFGCGELVDADAEGLLFPASALENGPVREKMDLCIDSVFWEELASRLAERDLRAELGVDPLPEPLTDEQAMRLEKLEDDYWTEFEAHGADRIYLLKGGQG